MSELRGSSSGKESREGRWHRGQDSGTCGHVGGHPHTLRETPESGLELVLRAHLTPKQTLVSAKLQHTQGGTQQESHHQGVTHGTQATHCHQCHPSTAQRAAHGVML